MTNNNDINPQDLQPAPLPLQAVPEPSESSEPLRELEAEYQFSDVTILDANGEYSNCLDIMKEEPLPWCLRSRLTLVHDFGMADMQLEFYDDARVIIISFATSQKDHVSNFDLRFLNSWCRQNGWKTPYPSKYVVSEMSEFWKHMWEVNIVDSPYLEERYGKRMSDRIAADSDPVPGHDGHDRKE